MRAQRRAYFALTLQRGQCLMHLLLETPRDCGGNAHPVDSSVLLINAGRDGQGEPQYMLLLWHMSLLSSVPQLIAILYHTGIFNSSGGTGRPPGASLHARRTLPIHSAPAAALSFLLAKGTFPEYSALSL